MTRGKAWTFQEENQLRQLLNENKSVRSIAKILGKTRECVRVKIARLGLEVVVQGENSSRTTTTSLTLPDELPSIEEKLKSLAAALAALEKGGLDKLEILRLRGIIQGVKVYQELIGDYVDFRALEKELFELRQKYEDLKKGA